MGSNISETWREDAQNWIRFVHAYTAPIICVVGFLCNILGSVCFIDMEMKAPITVLMTGLAISNALTLMVYIPFAMMLLNVGKKQEHSSAYAYTVMSAISRIFMNTSAISNWLTVTIAVYMLAVVQRICDPFKRIATSRAKQINCLVYLVVTVLCAPNYIDLLTDKPDIHPNVTVWTLGAGYETHSALFIADFNVVVNSVLMRLIPTVILNLAGFVLVKDMRQAVTVSRHIRMIDTCEATRWKSNRIETIIITKMLLAVLGIFTATESSNGTLMILAHGSRSYCILYTTVGHILTTIALMNYAVTSLLYSLMSSQFRETCKQAGCQHVSQVID